MKKIFTHSILLLLVALCSCQKAPINGDLDGQWHITNITTKQGESITPNRYFFNVSLTIAEFKDLGIEDLTPLVAHINYRQKEKIIYLTDISFLYADNVTADARHMQGYGLSDVSTDHLTIKVLQCDSKQLIMETDIATITCKKL